MLKIWREDRQTNGDSNAKHEMDVKQFGHLDVDCTHPPQDHAIPWLHQQLLALQLCSVDLICTSCKAVVLHERKHILFIVLTDAKVCQKPFMQSNGTKWMQSVGQIW